MSQLIPANTILIIDLAFIGDVILATPVVRAVRTAYPDAHLTMLSVPLTATIAAMNPYIDEVIPYDKRGRHRGFFGMFTMARELKRHAFDMVICMNFAVRGAVVAWLADIPVRVGYDAQHASLFLTHVSTAKRTGIQHETLNHLEVLRPLGLATQDTSLVLQPSAGAIASLAAKKERYNIPAAGYVAICPFGSYAKKNLSLAASAHLVRHLSQHEPVYLIGAKADGDRLEKIARLAGLDFSHILAGTFSLDELAAFLQDATCLVTVDTGPMHIAQAVGCPVAAVFGPTDPAIWGPRGEKAVVLCREKKCAPCWGKGTCHQNDCMREIAVSEILAAVEKLLEAKTL